MRRDVMAVMVLQAAVAGPAAAAADEGPAVASQLEEIGMGRNPATGEAIKIKASKKVAFRAAKELKEAI